MSNSTYSSAAIGILISPEDLHDVVERKASCTHPKDKGDAFCSRCGLPVVEAYTRASAFSVIREKLIEQHDEHGEINAVEFADHYQEGKDSRLLIGSIVSVGGSGWCFADAKDLANPASVKQSLREILEPFELWHDQQIQLHVFQTAS